jgi:hypothetical protein
LLGRAGRRLAFWQRRAPRFEAYLPIIDRHLGPVWMSHKTMVFRFHGFHLGPVRLQQDIETVFLSNSGNLCYWHATGNWGLQICSVRQPLVKLPVWFFMSTAGSSNMQLSVGATIATACKSGVGSCCRCNGCGCNRAGVETVVSGPQTMVFTSWFW